MPPLRSFRKTLCCAVLNRPGHSSSFETARSKYTTMQAIIPFLWFDGKAADAARFYTSIFKNSRIENITEMSATFRLEDQEFIAFNGGPMFTFSPAISFFVKRETQPEIDELW